MDDDPANRVLLDCVIPELRTHVEVHPDDARAHFILGHVYHDRGLLEHAIVMFQECLEVRELVLESYRMIGGCFSEKKGFNMEDLAFKQYGRGIGTPGFPDHAYNHLRYDLARLHVRRHEYGEACRLFRKIHSIDPAFHEAVKQWVDWCNRDRGADDGGGDDGSAPVPVTTLPRTPAASVLLELPDDEKPAGE